MNPRFLTRLAIPFSLFVVSVLCLSLTAGTSTVVSADKPNFVIVMADDMGYGDSSVYNGWIETPHMERMAREGLTFSDFHSSGTVCSPTRAGLMTGRYQQRAGIPGVINADPKQAVHHAGLQQTEITFSEMLCGEGYRTAIFGKWHLGYHKPFNPIHHGFERFIGFLSGNIDYISHYDRMETYDWWRGVDKFQEQGYLTHLLTQHATRFIRDHQHEPFCLYVSHGAVHTPIQSADSPPQRGPEKVRSRRRTRPRDTTTELMMQALDDSIGEILDALVETGLSEKTLVLFFSDNGGASHMRCDPLRGRKGTVWEGGHRVPAIGWWPGRISAGSRTDQLCITLDVMPTLLDLASIEPSRTRPLDGVSLTRLLLEGESLGRRQLFWNGVAMRDGHWKLVTRARANSNGPFLFDLSTDIGEQNNVASLHPDRVEKMRAALAVWTKDVATNATPQPTPQ